MRNHHRICDAQKHLLETLAKLKKKFIDNYVINLTIQHIFKSSQTSIPSTSTLNRDLQSQHNVYRLDVRNHHRICDAQKHLLHTLDKQKDKFTDNYIINWTIQHIFKSSQTSIPSTSTLNRDLQSQHNVYRLDVRNHHRICDAQKHLLHTLDKQKDKFTDNYIINWTINTSFKSSQRSIPSI